MRHSRENGNPGKNDYGSPIWSGMTFHFEKVMSKVLLKPNSEYLIHTTLYIPQNLF
jgi:hypothetical protein